MENVIELRLTNTDDVAIINADDFDKVSHINWYKDASGYAVKNLYIGDGKWQGFKLHRLIIDAPPGAIVDHINRNRLDNRKENLRIVTPLENARNVSLAKNNTSGYKGVSERNGRYEAHIRIDGVLTHIGIFATAEEAAKAYNVMAEEHFGEYAALNPVEHRGYVLPERRKRHSQYRGVSYHKQRKKWYAALYINGKMRHIGSYLTEEEAAQSYNDYAVQILGDDAILNVIKEEEISYE